MKAGRKASHAAIWDADPARYGSRRPIVGKSFLACLLRSTCRRRPQGPTTTPIPYKRGAFQIDFDFVDHVLWLRTSEGHSRQIVLKPMSVAAFHGAVFADLKALGIDVTIDDMPNEIPNAVPFPEDQSHNSYDREAVHEFWRILLSSHFVLSQFRTAFLGKVEIQYVFWGSFDLAVTRFRPQGLIRAVFLPVFPTR